MNERPDLDRQTYERCVQLFDYARDQLKLRIAMHHARRQLAAGDIFVFNRFAGAETFLPQYLLYHATGSLCRAVAAPRLFMANDHFARFLLEAGVLPHDHSALMKVLAVDILRGRKIVIFDGDESAEHRHVLEANTEAGLYLRDANGWNGTHPDAARLALGLQVFRQALVSRIRRGRHADLERWADELELTSTEALLENATRPVKIVPANVTFYPLRISDEILRRGAGLTVKELHPQAVEELIFEANLFFKPTDVDIRWGDAIQPIMDWAWRERWSAAWLARFLPMLDSIFSSEYLGAGMLRRYAHRRLEASTAGPRQHCAYHVTHAVTVNMSHLAACAVRERQDAGRTRLPLAELCRVIYLALKRLQRLPEIHLHLGLQDPDHYRQLLSAPTGELHEFLDAAVAAEAIGLEGDDVTLPDAQQREQAAGMLRIENPLEVYANDVEPLADVTGAVREAQRDLPELHAEDWARLAFDDELRTLEFDRRRFNDLKHRMLNACETATADPAPFLMVPEHRKPLGVVLVHGFVASPAEMRAFGAKLAGHGYPVIGVRLKGHGTSPWDLRERAWSDWLSSVSSGFDILRAFTERICIVGFSTGGALALSLAAETPPGLAGVVAVCPPLRFRNRNMRFVPLIHHANRFVERVWHRDGIMPFRPTHTEHPFINYRHMPMRGLYELTRMVAHLKKAVGMIRCPTALVQATGDPVIDPAGTQFAYSALGISDKALHWVDSDRHGILNEDIGDTQRHILEFLARRAAFTL